MLARLLPLLLCPWLLGARGQGDPCQGYPAFLCNTTFSDPRFLKTTSDGVIHIGVSLKIIPSNNHNQSKTELEFNEAFKVRRQNGWLEQFIFSPGRHTNLLHRPPENVHGHHPALDPAY